MRKSSSIFVIAGPTSSGKSSFARKLAAHLYPCDIINADSLQVYDALPLLTAQPLPQEWDGIPHHLYGVLPFNQSADVGWWLNQVAQKIQDLCEKKTNILIVGGTGLYLSSLLKGLAVIPPIPSALRLNVRQTAEKLSLDDLKTWAEELDPLSANLKDRQRLIRAIEVVLATGQSLSFYKSTQRPFTISSKTFLLMPPRSILYQRINQRFLDIIQQGVFQEIQTFLPHINHCETSTTLKKALGLSELVQVITGQLPLESAIERAQQLTRHYAKRQMTWFRHQFKADYVLEEENLESLTLNLETFLR